MQLQKSLASDTKPVVLVIRRVSPQPASPTVTVQVVSESSLIASLPSKLLCVWVIRCTISELQMIISLGHLNLCGFGHSQQVDTARGTCCVVELSMSQGPDTPTLDPTWQ